MGRTNRIVAGMGDEGYSRVNFVLLMTQTGISTFTTSIFTVLILWIAISETKSALITGVTSAMLVAPLLLNIVVGAIIDRARRKKIYAVLAPLLKSLSAAILLLVILNNSFDYDAILLFTSALLYGFSVDILVPVRAIWGQKFLRKQVYLKGMSVANLVSRSSNLTGYLVSALVIAISIKQSIVIVAVLYLISTIPVLLINTQNEGIGGKGNLVDIMREGLRYIANSKIMLEIVALSSIYALFWGMSDSVSTVVINRVFNLSSSYLSYTFFVISLGGIIGATLTSRLKVINKVGTKLSWIYGAGGASLLFIGILPTIYTLLLVFLIMGFLSGISSPMITATMFRSVSHEVMGRVQGAMDTFGTSFNSLSGFLAGLFMTIVLPNYVFFIMAPGLIGLAIMVSRFKTLSAVDV